MEIDFFEVLGVAPTEGGNEQEVAEPAIAEGGNEQEVAEPAEAETEEIDEIETEEAEGAENAPEERHEQSKEERAENARRRRKQEQQEAVRKAAEDAEKALKAKYDKIIAEAGLINPLDENKKPVTQIDELAAYNEARKQKQLERDLRAGKLTPEAVADIVANSEPYKQLQAAAEKATQDKEAAARELTNINLKTQMEEITAIDPTIKEVKDFLTMPDYAKFKSYVDKGCSYVEAMKLTRYEQLVSATAGKQAQAKMAKAAGKEHLTGSKSRGSGADSVPADVLAMYRMLNPGMSEAEYQAHYNKNKA